ncbi:hypothetical protein TWF569_010830 [Orbilia oligospora]|nr:hypothetical protein TWF103_001273 [Orbilia oligospora]KAF3132546.1 hypothetical protein TWF569_010830 [Orbilia oligospora]KAF3151309.1 hypothetical protein TWF594_006961 [Orbilia oligospora]
MRPCPFQNLKPGHFRQLQTPDIYVNIIRIEPQPRCTVLAMPCSISPPLVNQFPLRIKNGVQVVSRDYDNLMESYRVLEAFKIQEQNRHD